MLPGRCPGHAGADGPAPRLEGRRLLDTAWSFLLHDRAARFEPRKKKGCPVSGSPSHDARREGLRSRLLDRDLLLALLGLRRFRQCYREHAILELRVNLVGIDPVGHGERALEGAVVALGKVVILLLLFLFFFLLAFDGQRAIGDLYVDIAFVHSRQLGRDLVGFLLVDDIDGRSFPPAHLTAPERLDVEDAAPEGRAPGADLEILEQAIDFPSQALERPPLGRTIDFLFFGLYRELGCCFSHSIPPYSANG